MENVVGGLRQILSLLTVHFKCSDLFQLAYIQILGGRQSDPPLLIFFVINYEMVYAAKLGFLAVQYLLMSLLCPMVGYWY